MSAHRFIEIAGKRYLWRDLVQLRREQKKAQAQMHQPALFELKDDRRPIAERTVAGRYNEPSLFSGERAGRAIRPCGESMNESLHLKT